MFALCACWTRLRLSRQKSCFNYLLSRNFRHWHTMYIDGSKFEKENAIFCLLSVKGCASYFFVILLLLAHIAQLLYKFLVLQSNVSMNKKVEESRITKWENVKSLLYQCTYVGSLNTYNLVT